MAPVSITSERVPARRDTGPISTMVRLITPERITFLYPLAGPFRRSMAYLFDWLIFVLLAVLGFVTTLLLSLGTPEPGLGLFLVVVFLLQWGYGSVFEALMNGQTPGKRICRLRVVTIDGTPISGAQAVLRNLLWAVEGVMPLALTPAVCSMFLTSRFQRLGDLAAGTMVIVEERAGQSRLSKVAEPAVEALLPFLPARIDAGPELARSLADYVARRKRFGAGRREEMAAHLARRFRDRFGLPESARGDAILCAAYQRVFHGD